MGDGLNEGLEWLCGALDKASDNAAAAAVAKAHAHRRAAAFSFAIPAAAGPKESPAVPAHIPKDNTIAATSADEVSSHVAAAA